MIELHKDIFCKGRFILKKAIIVANTLKSSSVEFAEKAKCFLEEKGYQIQIHNDADAPISDAEFVIVLGGDGTILRAAKKLYGIDAPIFGINFGHLGYLSAAGQEDAIEGIERLIEGKYTVEERLMLKGEVVREGKCVCDFISLNEASVYRSTLMHALALDVMINTKHTEIIYGDGVIIATPTGSTSYNLSAGGPVLTPTSNSIVITPVSPRYFPRSSIVTDGGDETEIRINFETINETGAPCVEVDGDLRFALQNDDLIKIKRAEKTAKIIKITDESFYQILRKKLSN